MYVLVETEHHVSVTGLGVLEESGDMVLVGTPEHDAGGNAGILDCIRNNGGPHMEHLDAGGRGEEGDPRVITHSPSDGELSGTRGGRGGRSVSWAGAWRAGAGRARRGSVVRSVAVGLDRWVRWLGIGSARRGGAGSWPGLAVVPLLLLLGNSVVVREMPGHIVVCAHRDRKGLGGSERTEEDGECGEGKEV